MFGGQEAESQGGTFCTKGGQESSDEGRKSFTEGIEAGKLGFARAFFFFFFFLIARPYLAKELSNIY